MRAVTVAEARRDLDGLVRRVMDGSKPAVGLTESGQQVVLMPLDDYNTWAKTHYLLSSPANAAPLRKSIAEVEAYRIDGPKLQLAGIKGEGSRHTRYAERVDYAKPQRNR